MGGFCAGGKRSKQNPLLYLLKERPLSTLLDMWPSSYLQMLKQKYLAVNPIDGMDHLKFRTLFPKLKSQSNKFIGLGKLVACFQML
ncbi:unnamed protein product [Paramecium sonneborni]|uniref:Uncharacterized protein n=1 Tax=Paramecium sonneborni TaxID=65129 RepID=A0A8S1REQ6_9CILI|nr:unnamed protein product [Paramecium sonneborni]